jgi:hypothetical protein
MTFSLIKLYEVLVGGGDSALVFSQKKMSRKIPNVQRIIAKFVDRRKDMHPKRRVNLLREETDDILFLPSFIEVKGKF